MLKKILLSFCLILFSSLNLFAQEDLLPMGYVNEKILNQYIPSIHRELRKEFDHQEGDRTRRATREYGYSFFKMVEGDFSFTPLPPFLQELGNQICQSLDDEPVTFTNVIISYYQEGFKLEPHVDVENEHRYKNCSFYFGEKVYGLVIEPDSSGTLYFVKWDEDLTPPKGLKPELCLPEKKGLAFCLSGKWRSPPYFHGVSPIAKQRISITFRTVHKDPLSIPIH